jgi:hypothetical protein
MPRRHPAEPELRRRPPTQTFSPILIFHGREVVRRAALLLALGMAVAACSTAAPSASSSGTPRRTPIPTPGLSASSAPSSSPSPTPEPSFSVDLPQARDTRAIRFKVTVAVPADAGGRITVEVTNLSRARIQEIVLRWSSALREIIFLHPFVPSKERIADGGSPLRQEWTKWVEGPGSQGEPAGTTSLGYGPIDAGATLTIPLYVSRNSPGPIAFDLQFLFGEQVLSTEQGKPAETRVKVP